MRVGAPFGCATQSAREQGVDSQPYGQHVLPHLVNGVIPSDHLSLPRDLPHGSFPPSVTGNGTWRVDALARFNLSRSALGRPLGSTSADAAGLAILPGLVRWEEVAVKGEIGEWQQCRGRDCCACM